MMSFKPNKIRVIEFDTDYINSLKLIVNEEKSWKGKILIVKKGGLFKGPPIVDSDWPLINSYR